MRIYSTIILLIVGCLIPYSLCGRYAYATIHYEGTERDEEYLLGIRTLMKSIQLTDKQNDFIVLATDSVTQKTRDLLKSEGAKVIPIPKIENPYKDDPERRKYYTPRFEYTLIKLHLWNQTNYDRLIYMDADCIVLHNIEELFKCGHFCAVYMNIAAFHTAVMVVKPDAKVFQNMIDSLGTLDSYDGADQGFLVSYFKDMPNAPYFDSKVPSDDPMNRLYIGYSLNHIYFYEKATWDNGWRQGQFKDLPIPAYILTYPITANLKPFYWWGYIWFNVHWVWDSYRVQLNDSWTMSVVYRILAVAVLIVGTEFFIMKRFLKRNLFRDSDWPLHIQSAIKLRYGTVVIVTALAWSLLSLYLVYRSIPSIMPPGTALPLFFFLHNVVFFYWASKAVTFNDPSSVVPVLVVAQSIIFGFFTSMVLYWTASTAANAIYKILLLEITLIGYFGLQIWILIGFMFKKLSNLRHNI